MSKPATTYACCGEPVGKRAYVGHACNPEAARARQEAERARRDVAEEIALEIEAIRSGRGLTPMEFLRYEHYIRSDIGREVLTLAAKRARELGEAAS